MWQLALDETAYKPCVMRVSPPDDIACDLVLFVVAAIDETAYKPCVMRVSPPDDIACNIVLFVVAAIDETAYKPCVMRVSPPDRDMACDLVLFVWQQ